MDFSHIFRFILNRIRVCRMVLLIFFVGELFFISLSMKGNWMTSPFFAIENSIKSFYLLDNSLLITRDARVVKPLWGCFVAFCTSHNRRWHFKVFAFSLTEQRQNAASPLLCSSALCFTSHQPTKAAVTLQPAMSGSEFLFVSPRAMIHFTENWKRW